MIASIISLLDRQILSLLLIPIRADLGISDTAVSLLQGFAFAAVYTLAGLPIGYAVDRWSRRNIIIAGVLSWSAMTALCGLANGFWMLFLARVGVGLGEACLHPAAYSMISDLFSDQRRGRAFAAFGGAGTVGIAVSLFAGAAVIALIGADGIHLGPLGWLPMWKAAFIIASLPGFVVGLALLFVREPERHEVGTAAQASGFGQFLRQRWRLITLTFTSYGLISLAGYGAIAWMATGYVRIYGVSLASAGYIVGGIILVASVTGALVGGFATDRWYTRGTPGGRFRMVIYSGLIGAAAFALWWSTDSMALSLVGGVVAFTMQVAVSTSAPSVIAGIAPNEFRGRLSALYLLVTGMSGIAAGPTAVAFFTDHVFGYDGALRWSIICVTVPALLLAALCAWLSRHYYSRCMSDWSTRHQGEHAVQRG